MHARGQGAIEYILLIAGAILFVILAVSITRSTITTAGNRVDNQTTEFYAFLDSIQASLVYGIPADNCSVPASGNWVINTTVNCVGKSILMNGNISVISGGRLNLYGTIARMNAMYDGQYWIFVNGTGGLGVYDMDNNSATTTDASVITNGPANSTATYGVFINGTFLEAKNSELIRIGGSVELLLAGQVGFFTNNSIVTGNRIHDSALVAFVSSNNIFSNNKVYNNFIGGLVVIGDNNVVAGNEFWNNTLAAIFLADPAVGNNFSNNWAHDNPDSAVKAYWALNPGNPFFGNRFVNNNFSNNAYYGIRGACVQNLSMTGNIISNNAYGGIRLGMDFGGGNCSGMDPPAFNNISSNTITNNGLSIGGAEVLLCNASTQNIVADNVFTYGIINCTNCVGNVFSGNSNSTVINADCPPLMAAGSCPFVYSFDGENYWFEHESYQFSAAKTVEEYSYGRLQKLKPVNGYYRLRLSEELDEVSYTNGVRLYAVDAPEGAWAMPDVNGKIHAMREKIKPLKAVDKNGLDALEKVSEADGVYWVGKIDLLKDYSAASEEEMRGWLELEFPNRAGSSAKLFLRLRPSELLYWEYQYVASLIGNNFIGLTESLSSIPLLGDYYKEQYKWAGFLEVRLWNGKEWATQGYAKAGREIWNEALIELNTSGINEPVLRVRLESVLGHYEIDEAFTDYSSDEGIVVSPLYLESALTQDGEEVRELLEDPEDNNYLVQRKGDAAELFFREIIPIPRKQRSYAIAVKGYYNLIIPNNQTIQGFVRNAFENHMNFLRDRSFLAKLAINAKKKSLFAPLLG